MVTFGRHPEGTMRGLAANDIPILRDKLEVIEAIQPRPILQPEFDLNTFRRGPKQKDFNCRNRFHRGPGPHQSRIDGLDGGSRPKWTSMVACCGSLV